MILRDAPGVSAVDEVTVVVFNLSTFLASLLLHTSLLLEGVPAVAETLNVPGNPVVDAIPAVAGVPVIAATPYVAGIPGVAGVPGMGGFPAIAAMSCQAVSVLYDYRISEVCDDW
jgi:hypothetical protein